MGESEIDWGREAAYLAALCKFRIEFEKWHGFKCPRGAERFWTNGFFKGFKLGQELGISDEG